MKVILDFYRIEVVHLPPNLILMLSVFSHLCKALLGVVPDLDLFHLFYVLKKSGKVVIGGDNFWLWNK